MNTLWCVKLQIRWAIRDARMQKCKMRPRVSLQTLIMQHSNRCQRSKIRKILLRLDWLKNICKVTLVANFDIPQGCGVARRCKVPCKVREQCIAFRNGIVGTGRVGLILHEHGTPSMACAIPSLDCWYSDDGAFPSR